MNRQDLILRELNKTLLYFGYQKSSKIENYDKVYFKTYKNEDNESVSVYIYNCHNDYTDQAVSMFKDVCIQLIKSGYEIKMFYPCRISIEYKYE